MTGRQSVLCAVERMLWRGVFVALAAVFLTVLLPVLWDLLSPFLIGLAVAALLRPLITLTQEKLHMRRGLAVGLWVALAVLAAMWLVYWICSFVVVQLTVATPGVVTGVVDMLRIASDRLLSMAQNLPSAIGRLTRRTNIPENFARKFGICRYPRMKFMEICLWTGRICFLQKRRRFIRRLRIVHPRQQQISLFCLIIEHMDCRCRFHVVPIITDLISFRKNSFRV